MRLFLVRHAHALGAVDEDDAARPLSPKGRAQVERMAGLLRETGKFSPDEIWHSPLVRAAQTAEWFARQLRLDAPLHEVEGLAPDDDPRPFLRRLGRAPESIAVVGHEPHLSALASLLVAGRTEPPAFELKKCSVLALEGVGLRWVARWQISPGLIEREK